jgi:hypothetical protein
MSHTQSNTGLLTPRRGLVSFAIMLVLATAGAVPAYATEQLESDAQVKSAGGTSVATERPMDVQAADSSQENEAGSAARYHYPKWPERQYEKREMVPPPPPGPYMSTALSDHSVRGPSFSSQRSLYEEPRSAPMSPPDMKMFSPDRKWPRLRPEDDRGSEANRSPAPAKMPYARTLPPQAYPGEGLYRGQRWMPSMNFGSGRTMYHPPEPSVHPRPYPGSSQPYQNR